MTKQIVSSKAREDKASHDKEFFTPLDIKTLKKIIEIVGKDSVLDSYEDRLKNQAISSLCNHDYDEWEDYMFTLSKEIS